MDKLASYLTVLKDIVENGDGIGDSSDEEDGVDDKDEGPDYGSKADRPKIHALLHIVKSICDRGLPLYHSCDS